MKQKKILKTKICTVCKKRKSILSFYSKGKGRIDCKCKDCSNNIRKERYYNNRDHELKRRKFYYESNRDKQLEYGKQWYEEHREQRIDQVRKYKKGV